MLLVAVTTGLVLVAFLVPLGLLVRSSAADRATSAATHAAETVAPLVNTVDERTLKLTIAQFTEDDATQLPVTVYLPDGRILGAQVPPDDAVALARTGRSVTAQVDGGRAVLVSVQGNPQGTTVVRVFVSHDQLYAGVQRIWIILVLLGAALLALSLLIADRLARSMTRPLEHVATVAHRLAGGDLAARAVPEGPVEVRDVAAALNLLADRIDELLLAEREDVADLSHRLRTPLTALRLGVESLPDGEQRDRVEEAVDSMHRTVDLMIREARRPVREGVGAASDAAAVVRERLDFWAALAEDERRSVATVIPVDSVPVKVSRDDLVALVDALVGNVFSHTPEGTGMRVELHDRPGGGASFTVSDEGDGGHAAVVPQRGASGGESTGLGLDIVKRTAVASGGDLELGAAPGGGLRATVLLGAPRSSRADAVEG